jgi:hypothetical protein
LMLTVVWVTVVWLRLLRLHCSDWRGRAAHRRRNTCGSCWIDLGCCKCDSGTVANSPISCRSFCDGCVDWFRVPTAAPAQASRGGRSGLLGGAASLLRPEYPSHRYFAPAQPRASLVCRFPLLLFLSRHMHPFAEIERHRSQCLLVCCHCRDLACQRCAQI